jgi:hypothetical protein
MDPVSAIFALIRAKSAGAPFRLFAVDASDAELGRPQLDLPLAKRFNVKNNDEIHFSLRA